MIDSNHTWFPLRDTSLSWICSVWSCMIPKDEFALALCTFFILWKTFSGFHYINFQTMKKILFQQFCVWRCHCFAISVSYCCITRQLNFNEHLSLLMGLQIRWMVLLASAELRHTFVGFCQWRIRSSAWLVSPACYRPTGCRWVWDDLS